MSTKCTCCILPRRNIKVRIFKDASSRSLYIHRWLTSHGYVVDTGYDSDSMIKIIISTDLAKCMEKVIEIVSSPPFCIYIFLQNYSSEIFSPLLGLLASCRPRYSLKPRLFKNSRFDATTLLIKIRTTYSWYTIPRQLSTNTELNVFYHDVIEHDVIEHVNKIDGCILARFDISSCELRCIPRDMGALEAVVVDLFNTETICCFVVFKDVSSAASYATQNVHKTFTENNDQETVRLRLVQSQPFYIIYIEKRLSANADARSAQIAQDLWPEYSRPPC